MNTMSFREMPELDPIHDGRHVLGSGLLARESIPYLIMVPESGIAAFCYTWVNNDNKAGAAFSVFGPGVGESPITEAIDDVEVSSDMNFDSWKVGAVELRQDLKFKKAKVSIKGCEVEVDLTFDAIHLAYAYGSHPEGCPEYIANNRIEQAGWVSGEIRVRGKSIEFQSTGIRDHSWGTRDWKIPQHWKWLHAQTISGTCVHFWQLNAHGKQQLRGFTYKDGVMAEVNDVQIKFDLFDDFTQKNITAEVLDTANRKFIVEGRHYAHFPLVPGPHTVLNEAAMQCSIDGVEGVGWTEFMWPMEYLQYIQES